MYGHFLTPQTTAVGDGPSKQLQVNGKKYLKPQTKYAVMTWGMETQTKEMSQ